MKILAVSLGALRPDGRVSGGATKSLRDIARGLGRRGHDVRILCPRQEEGTPFPIGERVTVCPELDLKPSFPGPYSVSLLSHARLVECAARHARWAQVAYLNDAGFLYTDAFSDIPLVVSVRDLVYPETLQGLVLFKRDLLVVNSTYARDCIARTVARNRPGLLDRMVLIENGIDWDLFESPVDQATIRKAFSAWPIPGPRLLFPHRLEPNKGLRVALEAVGILVGRGLDPKLLVPRSDVDSAAEGKANARVQALEALVSRRGWRDRLVRHDWLPFEAMPGYYRMGDVTLCIGSFVESFGSNVVLESLASGTPVVQARVASHRTTLPEGLALRVDPDDPAGIADAVESCLSQGFEPGRLAGLRERFRLDRVVDQYEMLFQRATVTVALPDRTRPAGLEPVTHVSVPPWSVWTGRGLYCDFMASTWESPANATLRGLLAPGECVAVARLIQAGLSKDDLELAVRRGFLASCDG
jgi:glycosyltransferase involved in cell wall biosynthesis